MRRPLKIPVVFSCFDSCSAPFPVPTNSTSLRVTRVYHACVPVRSGRCVRGHGMSHMAASPGRSAYFIFLCRTRASFASIQFIPAHHLPTTACVLCALLWVALLV